MLVIDRPPRRRTLSTTSVALTLSVLLAAVGCTTSGEGGPSDGGSPSSAPATGTAALPTPIGPGNVLRVYHESMDFPTADEVAAAEAGMTIVLTFRLEPGRDGGR